MYFSGSEALVVSSRLLFTHRQFRWCVIVDINTNKVVCCWEWEREVQWWWHICMRQSWKQEVGFLLPYDTKPKVENAVDYLPAKWTDCRPKRKYIVGTLGWFELPENSWDQKNWPLNLLLFSCNFLYFFSNSNVKWIYFFFNGKGKILKAEV